MSLNNYPGRNRTAFETGVIINGQIFSGTPITGTNVTPTQAMQLAAPLIEFLRQIPYDIDTEGRLAYLPSKRALTHEPELVYGAGAFDADGVSLEGQPVEDDYLGGDFITKYQGAPMPFTDLDRIHPQTLEQLLQILNGLVQQIATAS